MSSITSSICSRKGGQRKKKTVIQAIRIQRLDKALQPHAGSRQHGPSRGACAVLPCSRSNPSAMTPAIQPGQSSGHDKAEASWSNPLLPPAATLHSLPTDTLLLPEQQSKQLPIEQATLRLWISPPCSTARLPATSFLQFWGQNLHADSDARAPDTCRGRRGNKGLLLGERLPTFNNRNHWIHVPHAPSSQETPPKTSSEMILGGTSHLLSGAGLEGASISSCKVRRNRALQNTRAGASNCSAGLSISFLLTIKKELKWQSSTKSMHKVDGRNGSIWGFCVRSRKCDQKELCWLSEGKKGTNSYST